MKVFLSYSSKHRQLVEELAKKLDDRADIEVWLDDWSLPGAADLADLPEAVADCDMVLVCVGEGRLGPWQEEEVKSALFDRISNGNGDSIVYALLPGAADEDWKELHASLRRRHYEDLRPGLDDARAFHSLLCALEGKPPGRPAPIWDNLQVLGATADAEPPPGCVVVAVRREGEEPRLCLGQSVGRQHVLTAFQAVRKGECKVREPANSKAGWEPASICWHDESLDTALLKRQQPEKDMPLPAASAHGSTSTSLEAYAIEGELTFNKREPRRAIKLRRLQLGIGTDDSRPALSGSPLWIEDDLAAVHRTVTEDKPLAATALSDLLGLEAFRKTTGLNDSAAVAEDERLVELRRQIAAGLERSAHVRSLLANKLEVSDDANEIAQAMLDSRSHELMRILNQVDYAIHQASKLDRSAAEAVHATMSTTLPFCLDWGLIREAERKATGEGLVDVPFSTEVFAELVLAASEKRPAHFTLLPGSGRITGGGAISKVHLLEPGFDRDGSQLLQAIVEYLCSKFDGAPVEGDFEFKQAFVAERLEFLRSPDNPERDPHYLVVGHEDTQKLARARRALRQQLPDLHIATLKPHSDGLQLELKLQSPLQALLRRRQGKSQ